MDLKHLHHLTDKKKLGKTLILCGCFLFLMLQVSAQVYINIDSARKLAELSSSEERFRGLRTLDRYYYTTGLFDSSALSEKEMFAIAKELKRDTMMAIVHRAIGNKYVVKTDYNFSIINYAKGLEYTSHNIQMRAGLYLNLAYVYIATGNNNIALDYIQRGRLIGQMGQNLYFENLLYGIICNNLGKPDSALYYFRQAENLPVKINDALLNSVFLQQTARAHELTGDVDLAEAFYKKAMVYSNEKFLPMSIIRTGNAYCDFLMKRGKYEQAKQMALEDLNVAKKAGINEGISTVAEVLRKLYARTGDKDSIIYYGQLQIDFKDSVSNQQKLSEFQNITFAQQLREIDEQSKSKEAEDHRKQNIQYALLALGIVILVIVYLLLSHRFITNTKMITFFGVIALLIVFEFLNLFLHPFLEKITNHSPVLMLLALVCIAALLVPFHHRLEKWAINKLVEKNKSIRLAAAKKTIEKLENNQPN
jgi:tetratricopeptide (TPR) repeat protein